MAALAEVLAILAAPIAELVKVALADDYDAEAERQALLQASRAVADYRMKKLLGRS